MKYQTLIPLIPFINAQIAITWDGPLPTSASLPPTGPFTLPAQPQPTAPVAPRPVVAGPPGNVPPPAAAAPVVQTVASLSSALATPTPSPVASTEEVVATGGSSVKGEGSGAGRVVVGAMVGVLVLIVNVM